MTIVQKSGSKRRLKRLVINDLRDVLIADISDKHGVAIRHKAFECLLFVENLGPGVVEVKPKGVLARQLTPGRALIDDARQDVLIDIVAGERADLILQPVCGGTVGLSPDVIAYFEFLHDYGYYRKFMWE